MSPRQARVFVFELAAHHHDLDAVAAETGEQPDLLRALYEGSAVSEALRRWMQKKRLPLAPGSG